MTVDVGVRRSSRRSIVAEDVKKESPYVSKRQNAKKEDKKAKKNVVNIIQEQEKFENLKPKEFKINVYKLQESKGDYSKDDIAKTVKMSREEKQFLIPKKGSKKEKPAATGAKKKGRKPKNNKSSS